MPTHEYIMNFSDSSSVDSNWFSTYYFPYCHQHGYVSVIYMYNYMPKWRYFRPFTGPFWKGNGILPALDIVKTSRIFYLVECWGATSSLRATAHQYKTENMCTFGPKTFITSLEVLIFFPNLSRYGYDSTKILSKFVVLHCYIYIVLFCSLK